MKIFAAECSVVGERDDTLSFLVFERQISGLEVPMSQYFKVNIDFKLLQM